MNHDLEEIWSHVQAQLALVVDEPTYKIWLEPLRALELREQSVVVAVPAHARRWIQERYGRAIQASIELALGPGWRLELTDASEQTRRAMPRRRTPSPAAARAISPAVPSGPGPLGNPKLTFEQFVIGDSNRLAHAAALTVAEMPGPGLQPALHLRPARRRQDPPAELDRQPAGRCTRPR